MKIFDRQRKVLSLLQAAFLIVICVNSSSQAQEKQSSASSTYDDLLSQAIHGKIQSLSRDRSNFEFTHEKALRARKAIVQHNFPEAKKLIEEMAAQSTFHEWDYDPFPNFLVFVNLISSEEMENSLNAWVAAEPNDPTALLVRGHYFFATALRMRGGGFAADVNRTNMRSFLEYSKAALADIEASIQQDEGYPFAFFLRVKILGAFAPIEARRLAFLKAVQRYPQYYEVYDLYLGYLEPKWGGTVEEMYEFVDQYTKDAEAHPALKMLHVSLYNRLLDTASTNCYEYWPSPDQLTTCIAQNMNEVVADDLEKKILALLDSNSEFDRYEFSLEMTKQLASFGAVEGGEAYYSTLLELTAKALGSDTSAESKQDNSGNYLIDRLVADSWLDQRNFDTAIKRYERALKNIDAMKFRNEERKFLAVSGLYSKLADANEALEDTPSMIAYQEAANALYMTNTNDANSCRGYFALGLNSEAIKSCSSIIEVTGDPSALYWRAKSYQQLGNADSARADYQAIVDNEFNKSDVRSSAARELAMIKVENGELDAALELLDKHEFLYDTEFSSRMNVALNFNTRCSIHMRLEEFEQALADCKSSLQYANLPDAFNKQQRIVAALKAKADKVK